MDLQGNNVFSRAEILEVLKEAGFTELQITDIDLRLLIKEYHKLETIGRAYAGEIGR